MDTDSPSENFRFFPAYSIETLADLLAREIDRRDDPFVPETVLITNYAQKIWLQHYLAQQTGICANIRFVSPEKFLNQISEAENETRTLRNTFDRDALAWRIFKTLRELHAPEAATPPEFLFTFRDNREEDFILTSQTLADLFWRYQSFRTEMIVAWTQGKDIPEIRNASDEFKFEYSRQKNLWQKLALREEEIPALRYRKFYEGTYETITKKLPKRLFVFAPTALPKTHFEMLKKLSTHTQILFYYHNLSDNFWVESRNRKSTLAKPQTTERGNELLTSWGKAARALAGGLIENNLLGSVTNCDEAPERDSLLHQLQADIRENISREQTPDDLFAQTPPPSDVTGDSVSLRVHAAHSRMREMEILRDDLRDLTARDSSILPRDILVMLPDIDAYAPFIRAVFEDTEFPFSLADNAGTERFSGITAFLSILKIAQGEVRHSELSALFDTAALARKLKLDDNDIALLKKMLMESNLRWGADADTRERKFFGDAETGQENTELRARLTYNNSWRFGLRRIALGVMMGNAVSDAEEPLEFGENRSILPSENLPENAAELAGKCFCVFDAITTLAAHYSGEAKTIAEWCRFLKLELADALFEFSDEESEEEAMLADAIDSVRHAAEIAGIYTLRVGLKTVVSMLENRSWESRHGTGMLRGKITFCRLQPLRNIPAKAVYIAGMNAGEFPRPARKSALDLIAQWPKVLEWDRSSRDEDCLLLLEAVLAAKTYLRFSYIGRNAKNNFVIRPCTPLAKLIDEVVEILLPKQLPADKREAATQSALNQFFFEHAPQNSETGKLTTGFAGEKTEWRPPLLEGKPLPLSEHEREKFSLLPAEQIADFFTDPATFFCTRRLNLKKAWKDPAPSDSDPAEGKIQNKYLLPQLTGIDIGTITNTDLGIQNDVMEKMREYAQKIASRKYASGEFSVLTRPEDLLDAKNFPELNSRHATWAKLINRNLTPGTQIFPLESRKTFTFESVTYPASVCVHTKDSAFKTAEGETCVIKVFPGIYKDSKLWEFKIRTVIHAAFLRAAFPNEDFTFIGIHPDFVTRTQAAVGAIESGQIPPDFAEKLLKRFFEGLENPPPYFAAMPLPANADADAFLNNFSSEESKDYSRPFREFLFGSNFPGNCADTIRTDCFEFANEIARFFPESASKNKRSKSEK